MAEPLPEQAVAELLERYYAALAVDPGHALNQLCSALTSAPSSQLEACAAALRQRGDLRSSLLLLDRGLALAPHSDALRFQVGETLRASGDVDMAEGAFRRLLGGPENRRAALGLAELLREQGRLSAATSTMAGLLAQDPADAATTRERLRFISQCQRAHLAWELCQHELQRFPQDSHLRAFAARIAVTLGRFDDARHHYLGLLNDGVDLNELFVLQALSGTLKYSDRNHPDFELFARHLSNASLTPLARASILFAQGKASDDIGDWASAAAAWREANALIRADLSWSRSAWQHNVEQRIAAVPLPVMPPVRDDFVPVFVVGLPRSGTTLVSELLGRHPLVRNRGELALIPYLEKWVEGSPSRGDPNFLRRVAAFATAHLRQDDEPARYYVDKNPLNFRALGLIASLLPQSRIIYCTRNLRDTALSIWAQYFARGDDNGYAYDWQDLAAFADGCERLMAHWRRATGLPIYTLEYERMIEQPADTLRDLTDFLGLPRQDLTEAPPPEGAAITTSSAWQARQQIYTGSRGRWAAYLPFIPELSRLPGN